MSECVRACVRACVPACVRACVCVCLQYNIYLKPTATIVNTTPRTMTFGTIMHNTIKNNFYDGCVTLANDTLASVPDLVLSWLTEAVRRRRSRPALHLSRSRRLVVVCAQGSEAFTRSRRSI